MKFTPVLLSIALGGPLGCDTENATTVVVDNDYPSIPDGGDAMTEMTVFKVWWVTTLLPDAVRPGGEGQVQRTVPNTDYAYAVLAPGWDASSRTPPSKVLAARSVGRLALARGDTLHVHVSDGTFLGNCAAGTRLSQDDADFITRRIFPAEFAGVTYDAQHCATSPASTDGGDDATDGSLFGME
jgi:hypothetical protein